MLKEIAVKTKVRVEVIWNICLNAVSTKWSDCLGKLTLGCRGRDKGVVTRRESSAADLKFAYSLTLIRGNKL